MEGNIMTSLTKNTLASGVAAGCLLMNVASANATAYTIKIGVAANFNNTVLKIINAYKSYYSGNSYTFTVTSDSTGNLKSAILAGGTNGPYDIFLSADTAAPAAVATLGMVYSGVTQSPFFYATGSLVLAARAVNIADCPSPAAGNSCGLPTTGSSVYTHFVIADPSKAPYGLAALSVVNQAPWSLGLATSSTYPVVTFPASYVYTDTNIGTTFSDVNSTTPSYAYGFVAKSQVCASGSLGANLNDGTLYIKKAFEYKYDGSSSPNFGHTTTTSQTYSKIVQNGIALQRSAQTNQAEVLNFVNYILGSLDGQGTTWRTKYCYGTTP
jgi:molybdate transport system substrate-binding protein